MINESKRNRQKRTNQKEQRIPYIKAVSIGPAMTYFSSMWSVIGTQFLSRIMYRETYAQKVQCLKRLLGKGKCQDRRVMESVLCDSRCLESL